MSATPRRALIVVDVQNEYISGQLPIMYPPVQESLPNIGKAMDAAHAAGIPIVVVQHVENAEAPIFARGSLGCELHSVVTTRSYDHLIPKSATSSFAGTDFAQWLIDRKIDTLAVAGYMTHNCNAAIIFQAKQLGFTVEFLSDAGGSLPYRNDAGHASAEEIHRVFSVVFHSNFAAVLPTADWIAAVTGGLSTQRGGILASNRSAREAT